MNDLDFMGDFPPGFVLRVRSVILGIARQFQVAGSPNRPRMMLAGQEQAPGSPSCVRFEILDLPQGR
jgi:hypothetical protein